MMFVHYLIKHMVHPSLGVAHGHGGKGIAMVATAQR